MLTYSPMSCLSTTSIYVKAAFMIIPTFQHIARHEYYRADALQQRIDVYDWHY